ncbi:MAG TPA: hypothetical protein PLE92_05775 [Lentisphaeria bacterium]|nr:hypothetical protein [Lentisphaerota bacterium]OQC17197.1 MAG: hypothetical protein BWX73_00362 [Lentisphaerae bacterium ADurb.Bin082]HQC52623.1 hypothetical protein [Lentisphaeria bacterium]
MRTARAKSIPSLWVAAAAWILLFCAVGCRREVGGTSYFREAMRHLDDDQPTLAIPAFELAILHNDHAFDAHVQLGLLSERMPGRQLQAVWHYRQCLELEPNHPHQTAIREWLAQAEKVLLAELQEQQKKDGEEERKQRVRILEEHALRQKEWISELSQENRELRQRLAELQADSKGSPGKK